MRSEEREQGGRSRKKGTAFTAEEKRSLLEAYEASGAGLRAFCAERGLNTASFCAWRRAYAEGGAAGLEPRPNPRNAGGRKARRYTPEERRQAVEAYLKSGRTRQDFAKLWGLSDKSLSRWVLLHREEGPRALERPSAGRGRGKGKRPLPSSVKAEITKAIARFPGHGLRRIRDFLFRFRAMRVSAGTVRRAREEEGIVAAPRKRRPRRRELPRRFERANAMDLWQSDITSFVLARHGQRCYLAVFLDDFSRYVVAFGLALRQKQDLVIDALSEGISRFGKPLEVLTDQGRQYFSWRGKSDFTKLLEAQGIRHVVARAHHPETVGKCERLWETVRQEYWERARPEELDGAREGLRHFFAHYNHFRPHQGIDGMAPADRFLGAEAEVRRAIEARLEENELAIALGKAPRPPDILLGTLGGRAVLVAEEGGRLILKEAGDGGAGEKDEAIPEAAIQAGAPDAAAGEGALGPGDGGGEEGGARDGIDDPRVVDREVGEGGGGGETEGAAAAAVAALAARARGDGGGPPEAAAVAEDGGDVDGPGERPEGAEAKDRGAGAAARADGGAGEDPAGVSGEPGSQGSPGGPGGEADHEEKAQGDRGQGSSEGGSGSGSGAGAGSGPVTGNSSPGGSA